MYNRSHSQINIVYCSYMVKRIMIVNPKLKPNYKVNTNLN